MLRKILALLAISLMALNLRTSVTSLSPIIFFIEQDIVLSVLMLSSLAMAAPLMFAAGAAIGTRPARRFGLEVALIAALAAIITGHLLRGLALESTMLLIGTLLSLIGMGIGNLLMPSLVRKYFPNSIGPVSALYIALTSVSTFLPPLIAVQTAEVAGWRFSLLQWILFAGLALIPMLGLLLGRPVTETENEPDLEKLRLWKSPTAIAIMGIFALSSMTGYIGFGWLPQLLVQHAEISISEAATMLSLFAFIGFPAALIAPIIASRFPSSQAWMVAVAALAGSLGAVFIIFNPSELLILWIALLGLGQLTFPIALTLFNLRSRNRSTVLLISSFAQVIGYLGATLVVAGAGLLASSTDTWVPVLGVMAVLNLIALLAALQLAKGNMIEDELQGS